MTGYICIPKEKGDSLLPEPRCPYGFKIATCKICNVELKAAGVFCPKCVPIFINPENKGYKA